MVSDRAAIATAVAAAVAYSDADSAYAAARAASITVQAAKLIEIFKSMKPVN